MIIQDSTIATRNYAAMALRHQYPRPQLRRENWINLNGAWRFGIDRDGAAGIPRKALLDREIIVPFAPETKASGIADTGKYKSVFYSRTFQTPRLSSGDRLFLHFGAVDYRATVYVNGRPAGRHEGGYTPFSIDVTDLVKKGRQALNELIVRADDDPDDLSKPRGKQDWQLDSHSIWYWRTTGIWQTVWLERVPYAFVSGIKWSASVENWELGLSVSLAGALKPGMRLSVRLTKDGVTLADDSYGVSSGEVAVGVVSRRIKLPDGGIDDIRERLLWSPEHPHLIDAVIELTDNDGKQIDRVESYTAMRSVSIQKDRFVLNNRPLKLRLVLNQGYWDETGMTAPDDDAFKRDVELVKEMGFNGVRMHQKIENPRFLYWADTLGLIVWAEMPSAYTFNDTTVERVTSQWMAAVKRDLSHPCIVAWVPVNESWAVPNLPQVDEQRRFVAALYHLTRSLDPGRPVIGNDGWEMVATDIIAIHDYHHDADFIATRYGTDESAVARLLDRDRPGGRILMLEDEARRGRPVMLTEFGGIKLSPDDKSWGYSVARTPEELEQMYVRLLSVVARLPLLAGFCYTQFTDTYQEANGLLHMDRTPKFPLAVMAKVNSGE